jgi:tetratricopeptide (TPR) repeat protein
MLFHKYNHNILNNFYLKNILIVALAFVLMAHTYGVRKRVAVWDNGKSLWYDVSVKSPKNGRGLMNYGTKLMSEGNYEGALDYFNRALEFSPYYSYLYTNIAIANNAKGNIEEAEKNHKKAISLAPNIYNTYYYYANFLKSHNRINEAVKNLEKAIKIAPHFAYSYYALMEIYFEIEDFEKLEYVADKLLQKIPDDITAQNYKNIISESYSKKGMKSSNKGSDVSKLIQKSLFYYENNEFDKVINICNEILKIDENNATAYNNLCATYNKMQLWDKAIESAEKSLQINPDNQLTKNNLEIAKRRKRLDNTDITGLGYDELINLGLTYYNEEMYKSSIKVFKKAIQVNPNNVLAYNNLCATYNAIENYQEAIKYGEKAIQINPENELAKNNLNYSIRKMNE